MKAAAHLDGKRLECTEVVVQPSTVSWEHCALVSLDDAVVVGCEIHATIEFRDQYSNPIDPANVDMKEYKLVRATASNNGVDIPASVVPAPITDSQKAAAAKNGTEVEPSFMVTCKPTVTGLLSITLAHSESDHALSLSLDVISGGIQSAQCTVLATPESGRAGDDLQVLFELKDTFGNPVTNADPSEILCTACPDPPVEGAKYEAFCTHATPEQGMHRFLAHFKPTVAGTAKLLIHVKPKTSTEPPREFAALSAKVVPSSIAAKHTTITPVVDASAAPTYCAGTKVRFEMRLFDSFKNMVFHIPVGGEKNLRATNGTATLPVDCSPLPEQPNATPGTVMLEVMPTEVGPLTVFYDVAGEAPASSAPITVGPAKLQWSSCTLKIMDESIKLGNETTLVIAIKDPFGNAVKAVASEFTVKVINGDAEVEHEGLMGTKNIITSFKPLQRGTVYCEVAWTQAPGEVRRSNEVPVV